MKQVTQGASMEDTGSSMIGRRGVFGVVSGAALATAASVATATSASADPGQVVASGGHVVDTAVADRGGIKALDPGTTKVVYLTEPGREGTFVWRAGDFSDHAAADAREGVYIVSDSSPATDGAWVRVHDDRLNIRWFGAVGDGVADDSQAVQGAFDLVEFLVGDGVFTGLVVYVPTGLYRMMSQAVCQIDNRPVDGVPGISVTGDGPQSSYFVADESNADGLIKLTSNFNAEVWQVYGISLLSALPADSATNNGVALEISSSLSPGTPGFGSHRRRSVRIENVYIGAYANGLRDLAFDGNFEKGIYLANKWWAYITDVYINGDTPSNMFTNFYGPRQPDPSEIPSEGELMKYELTGRTHAIHFKDCYSPVMTEIYVNGFWRYGVKIEGRDAGVAPNDFEDFRIADSFLVGMDVAFEVWHADDLSDGVHFDRLHEPGGAISNCHINAHTYGIRLRLHRQVVVSGVYFYTPRGRGLANYEGLPSALFLDGADDITVIGCLFLEPGFYLDQDNATCGIRTAGRVTANIVGTTFAHGGIGIRTDGDGEGSVTVTSSQFVGATVDDVWATFVPRVDNAGILAEAYVERKGGDQPGSQHVVRSSGTGVGSPVRSILRSERPDYATTSDPILGDWQVAGPNASGTEVTASVIRTRLHDNADGGEVSGLDFFALGGGAQPVRVAALAGTAADGETTLLLGVQVDGGLSVRTVEVGDADSGGPGYRSLRVIN